MITNNNPPYLKKRGGFSVNSIRIYKALSIAARPASIAPPKKMNKSTGRITKPTVIHPNSAAQNAVRAASSVHPCAT